MHKVVHSCEQRQIGLHAIDSEFQSQSTVVLVNL